MLQVIHGAARLVLGVVVQHRVGVRPVKGSLYLRRTETHTRSVCNTQASDMFHVLSWIADLMAKHESRDTGHQLGEEDERQEHGILQREKTEMCIVCIKTLCQSVSSSMHTRSLTHTHLTTINRTKRPAASIRLPIPLFWIDSVIIPVIM